MKYAHIVGWGSFLPDRVLSNDDIAKIVDTSDEWIYARTGIRQRHIAAENETTATLAFEAAARALAVANLHPSQVDLIIVATSTPEYIFPSTASRVQDYLGAARAGAFDLAAACSGFVYALNMASPSRSPRVLCVMQLLLAPRRCLGFLIGRTAAPVFYLAMGQARWC